MGPGPGRAWGGEGFTGYTRRAIGALTPLRSGVVWPPRRITVVARRADRSPPRRPQCRERHIGTALWSCRPVVLVFDRRQGAQVGKRRGQPPVPGGESVVAPFTFVPEQWWVYVAAPQRPSSPRPRPFLDTATTSPVLDARSVGVSAGMAWRAASARVRAGRRVDASRPGRNSGSSRGWSGPRLCRLAGGRVVIGCGGVGASGGVGGEVGDRARWWRRRPGAMMLNGSGPCWAQTA